MRSAVVLCCILIAASTVRALEEETREPGFFNRALLYGSYAALYGTATRVGSQRRLDSDFVSRRLETAYVYDLVAHVWVAQQIGEIMGVLHHRAGAPKQSARRRGAWLGAFGALSYMELINGFVPGVRFDPYDPLANALGAWLAAEGPRLVEAQPELGRLSLQFGYRDWSRVFRSPTDREAINNIWHDYPNSRIGLGVDVGPLQRPWVSVLWTYGITSFDVEEMKNRFTLGIELLPVQWFRPWLLRVPCGETLVGAFNWVDRRIILPALFFEIWSFDMDPFSNQKPFQE